MIEFKRSDKELLVQMGLPGHPEFTEFIDAETLLKQVLTAYLDGVEEPEDEKLAMLAHVAGFDVEDKSGEIWKIDEPYRASAFNCNWLPFRILRPQPEPSKAEKLQARVDALQKELDAIKAELKGGV